MTLPKEMADIYLPKWPGLIVAGDSVTKEQAAEIIVRTDSFRFSTNNERWKRTLAETLGAELDKYGFMSNIDESRRKYRVLSLNYLHNSRIATSYIGGSHGWINWDGTVGCDSYNIGKHPSVGEVYEDLRDIAKTWNFLNFKVQLLNHENGYPECAAGGPPGPIVEFSVSNGEVSVYAPTKQLAASQDSWDGDVGSLMTRREVGCTVETFKAALKLAEGLDKDLV